MRKLLLPLLFLVPLAASAQEDSVRTQTLVRPESKANVLPTATALTLKLDGHETPLISLTPVNAANTQVALLIDDGLSRSAGVQLKDLQGFISGLPPATEVLVGYMSNGRIETIIPFTTDHAAAAAKVRIPLGVPGVSASPYFCLSEFVKQWPGPEGNGGGQGRFGKARFVMMITNGVDPYNGSTSILNQDSPYVASAINDAQRAGVVVSSVYYRDAGYRGGSASFSGQSYLQQVAEGTGGESYYQGTFTPVSLTPYLQHFTADISDTYIATFNASVKEAGRDHLLSLKVDSTVPKLKFRHPSEVRPGNRETGVAAQ